MKKTKDLSQTAIRIVRSAVKLNTDLSWAKNPKSISVLPNSAQSDFVPLLVISAVTDANKHIFLFWQLSPKPCVCSYKLLIN